MFHILLYIKQIKHEIKFMRKLTKFLIREKTAK